LEDALMFSREQAKKSGVELQVAYADDLPQEIATNLVHFMHVVRNLADYALEFAGTRRSPQVYVKKNGELLKLTVTGMEKRTLEASVESSFTTASSDPPRDRVAANKLELVKEHVELLMGHMHVVNRAAEDCDITVCVPCV